MRAILKLRWLPVTVLALAGVMAAASAPAQAAATPTDIAGLFAQQEGGTGIVNTASSAAGTFQTNFASLQRAGFITGAQNGCCGVGAYANAQWNGPLAQQYGVNSLQDYLNNPAAQRAAFASAASNNYADLTARGGAAWVGRDYPPGSGFTLNQSALLECAYVLGGGGCANALQNGTVPDYVLKRMGSASGFDSSALTGQPTAPGGGNLPAGTNTSPTGSALGLYCNPDIMQQMLDNGRQMADAWTLLAERPETGYTLLGGQSVLDAAGVAGSGSNTGFFGGASFAGASCLDRLLNSSLDIIFTPPTMGDLLGTLTQIACRMATQLFTEVTAPLNQSVYEAFSTGGIIPGMNLGSITGGANMRINPGGQANGGIINMRNGGSTAWYSSGGLNGGSYGSMFGPGGYGGFGQ